MFTGLIQWLGQIISLQRSSSNVWELVIDSPGLVDVKLGDSIAINGVCLTVVECQNQRVTFTLMQETLDKTTFPYLEVGQWVHVERAVQLHERLDGHILTGHVAGIIFLQSLTQRPDGSAWLVFDLPEADKLLTPLGSVAIDGVSLTVADLTPSTFAVSLIPYTQEKTRLTMGQPGHAYNLELEASKASHGSVSLIPRRSCPDPMGLARRLSRQGRITAPSNPWVGCVICDAQGNVVATGFHRKRGERHAETNALAKLGPGDYSTYTLYCTLEPCNHTGLQPPCTDAIIKSGIRRVVVGILDPDTRVAGSGVNKLRQAGVDVTVLVDARITQSLRSYIHHRQTGRPYVVAKVAMSLDGRIAPVGVGSFSLSNARSRQHSHELRLKSQAILVGTQTALLDQPHLTVRLPTDHRYYIMSQEHRPLRCFLDTRGQITTGPLLDSNEGPSVAITNDLLCAASTRNLWRDRGIQTVSVPMTQGQLDLTAVLTELGRRGVLQLLVEGGAKLLTTFLNQNLIDEFVVYLTPHFLGSTGVPLIPEPFEIPLTSRFRLKRVQTFESDIVITYKRP
jgi:diaminohydroxyphosphoribosylaminopyrimidine deaminase/5-amino-6-(5-phosphoribosylamino)uracil reductase